MKSIRPMAIGQKKVLDPNSALARISHWCLGAAILLVWLAGTLQASQADSNAHQDVIELQGAAGAEKDRAAGGRQAVLVRVELPLDSHRELQLLNSLERLSRTATGTERALVVLEFLRADDSSFVRPADGIVPEDQLLGRGTSFERALSIARWLTSPKGNRLHTIAYLPESVAGHATLIALACEEIAMPLDVEFGKSGIDEASVDPTVRQAYSDITERRGSVFPKAAVMSMVDPNDPLFRIDFLDGTTQYASKSDIDKRERQEGEWKEEQLVPNGHFGWFQGSELRNWKWISYSAKDREQLANVLRLTKPITDRVAFDGPRVAVRGGLHGKVSQRIVDRMIRAIEQGLENPSVNLLLVEIDSPGGNLTESLRLAQYLADLPNDQLEVVCYVRDVALGDAALVALAGDALYMHPDATIGGPGEATIHSSQCLSNRASFDHLARTTGRSVGELMGVVCPELAVYEYATFDGRKTLLPSELVELSKDEGGQEEWQQGKRVSFSDGLSYSRAEELGVVYGKAESWALVASHYGLEKLPDEIRTNSAEQLVDWLAGQMWLSFALFFIGLVALSAELGAPGIGFPGILAGICFGLFFWLRLLDGTVEWLEILLIAGGILCLLLELFVMPGFGVFGVSGLIMLGLGLLLAGQTFVWPTNDYQRLVMVKGIGQIAAVSVGLTFTAVLFRKQIMASPLIKWLSLAAPSESMDKQVQMKFEEELQSLVGRSGHTMTRCNPLGRATVGGKIVNVACEEGWIDEDSEIVVTGTQGHQLIVRRKG